MIIGRCCIVCEQQIYEKIHDDILLQVKKEVLKALVDRHAYFICSLENELHLEFANIIINLRDHLDIKLEILLPFKGILNNKSQQFRDVASKSNVLGVCQPFFDSECFEKCNSIMIENAHRVIFIGQRNNMNDSKFPAIEYALFLKKDIRIINI